ncbi:MAG: glycosyltransferase [Candidatus Latescibacteria bacterium]|nr:glycosyltransferase [Candidatus Latescibacterota bacterium]
MSRESKPEHAPPLVTVGIACYNAQDTIARAVASALTQTWPRLEVLVVDDCSNDRSREIVERLAADDPRVRVVGHAENRGPGAARQTTLDHARGEYVAFFDDDDESGPERVATQYRCLSEGEARFGTRLVACYASGERVYPNGYRMRIDAIGSSGRAPAGGEVVDYLLFNRREPGVFYGGGTPACALMASIDAFRAAGGFDPDFRRSEDADFAVRFAFAGGHVVGCPEWLYLQHATEAPDKSAARNFDAEMRLLEKHRAYLEEHDRYAFARNWFTVRYHHFNHDHGRMALALLRGWFGHPVLVTRQLLTTVPARFFHERRSSRDGR